MPYINRIARRKYDQTINDLLDILRANHVTPGDINYVFSSIVWRLFDSNKSYTTGNELIGVLECVKQEFYRKKLAIYEDIKEKENGSL